MSAMRKKRVSKKNKASWRKHSDIQDVEDFLEDQRLEERIGKAETKKDEELFTIDVGSGDTKKSSTSKKSRRLEKLNRPPRAWASLENTSKVEDPISKRNHVKKRRCGRDVISHILAGKTSNRITQALHDSKRHSLQRRKEKLERKAKIFRNDLWEEKDAEAIEYKEYKNDWIEKELALYHLQKTGRRLIPRPTTADLKTSRATPLELPHPGMSYNPTLKSHQELMNQVIERESKIIKEEKHLKRVTVAMFSKMSKEERDLQDLKEATAGLDLKDEEDAENNEGEDLSRISINPPVKNKKKDKKSRRKQREQREMQQERKKLKLEKKKITDIHRLRAIKSEVAEEEKKTEALMKSRKQTAEERKYKPRRLGKLKFQEPEIPVNMISDLTGSLRNLKTESSVLLDRFKSLQRRNILSPSADVGIRKRAKIKRFVRSSHKEEQKPLPKKKKI